MSSGMLDKRGKTFTVTTYVIAGGFALIVFGMLMAAYKTTIASVFNDMIGHYAQIATVGITALGLKGTAEGWKRGAQPTTKSTVTVETKGEVGEAQS